MTDKRVEGRPVRISWFSPNAYFEICDSFICVLHEADSHLSVFICKKIEYNISASEMLQIEIKGSYSKFPNDIALV